MKALLRKIRQLLRNRKFRRIWYRGVSTFAAIVVFVTTYALVLPAITLEIDAQCGIEAHQHDSSCYTEVLTCAEPESDGHEHDDSCYTITRELVCEAEEHQHDMDCYDENGELVCIIPEHTHEDDCYKETKELTCEKEESEGHHHDSSCYEKILTCGKEVHVHSAACYKDEVDVVAEAATESTAVAATENASAEATGTENMPVEESTGAPAAVAGDSTDMVNDDSDDSNSSFTNATEATEDIREHATVDDSVENDEESAAIANTEVRAENGDLREASADTTEEAITPIPVVTFDDSIRVRGAGLASDSTSLDPMTGRTTIKVHVEGDQDAFPEGTTMVLSAVDDLDSVAEAVQSAVESSDDQTTQAARTRGFHAVDISFRDSEGNEIEPLKPIRVSITSDKIKKAVEDESMTPVVVHVEDTQEASTVETDTNEAAEDGVDSDSQNDTLTFEAGSFSVYAVVYTVDFHWGIDGEEYEYSLAGGDSVSFLKLLEMLSVVDSDEPESGNETKAAAGAAGPGTLDEFIGDIKNVEFSDENLVKVVRITEDTTAGVLKERLGLECEYSAELTEAEQEAMDSREFYAPDWALISLKAFDTEEVLTVEMKTGENFQIKVTDAQIQKNYISASGETYTITVTYEEDAEIPEGADLEVREILAGTEEYEKYLKDSAKEVGVEDSDISFARFFDITIIGDAGEKIEPKSPVRVEIAYQEEVLIGTEENLSIIHFADQGTEIISDVGLNADGTTITYLQDSFSVTGTVVSGGPRNGQQYMMVVEYEGTNYIINNDGTLTPVNDVDASHITTDSPMLWTYYYQYGAHFRFASEASGFNADQTASGFYYRYIDPNVASGLSEENKPGNEYNGDTNLTDETQIYYNGTNISSVSNNSLYIGVSNEGGTLHITGQQNSRNAARITLYSADQVRPSDPANHTVNHIDISISGSAQVDVPLAYGIYYYKDGNGDWKKIIVGTNVEDPDDGVPLGHAKYDNHTESLTAQNIGITSDDMKRATIKAYETKTVDGQQVADLDKEVNNAFYITGYSANETTLWSTDQVRIEGSFKVSTMNPVNPNNWWDVNSEATRHERKSKAITYVVEASKKLQLPLTYTDDEGHKYPLYQSATDNEPMTITAEVPMGASFNYWTDIHGVGNECPPLQEAWGYRAEWRDGGIHPWGISGMDFVLTSHVTNVPANIVALEITKKIVDENGNVIGNITAPIESTFEVYQDKPGDPTSVREVGSETHDYGTYSKLHDQHITIATNGNGHKYDYNVSSGMYYVRESREGLPTQIQTTDGKTYNYIRTEIKTEYAYRANQYRVRDDAGNYTTHQMHEATIISSNANLNSIPEVLGVYKDDNGDDERNEFLEFYFYNVYSETETPPPPEPVYKNLDIELDKKWQDGDNTEAPADGSITFKLHQIQTQTINNQTTTETDAAGSGYPKTFTVRAADGWKLTIPDLPWYETDTHDNYVKTYKYYLEEDVSAATGSAANYKAPSFTNGYGSINRPVEGQEEDEVVTVEVTNKTGNVIRIQKRWINIDPDTAPSVTIKIWRQKLKPGGSETDGSIEQYGEPIVLSNDNRVEGENWWQREIALPTDLPPYHDVWVWTPETGNVHYDTAYGDYAYFITEDNPDGTSGNTSQLFKDPRFFKLKGDEAVDDYDAFAAVGTGQGRHFGNCDWGKASQGVYYNGQNVYTYVKASDATDNTLMVMNAPKDSFAHVYFSKAWFKFNEQGQLVQAGENDTRNYAIGLQLYQKLSGTNTWHAFAKPFYIASSTDVIDCNGHRYIMDENNPFKFNEEPSANGNIWRWLFIEADDSRNGFPRYALINGQRISYEYEAREIGIYQGSYASTADELTRVYDYTTVQDWTFDSSAENQQNNGPQGINVQAGKLNVTKTWQGGNVGSRIYFEVYRGGENITSEIVADPESYGLTEQQVIDDGSHRALIVTSDGANWSTLLIQGLAMAPASGGTAYQYSIKEIGYSESDGTDWWDGEVVTNSDGSVRKDPQGNDVVAHISELLTGYQIDSGGSQTPVSGKSPATTITDDDPHTITVNNTYVEKYKDFEFTKVWENGAGEMQTWPSDISSIKVDLYAKAGTGNPIKIAEGIDFYVTPPSQTSTQEFTWKEETYKWEVSVDASGKVYTFKIPNLPAKVSYPDGDDYEYSVVEQPVTDYTTGYGHISETQKTVEVKDGGGNTVYQEDGVTPKTETVTVKSFVAEDADSASNGKVISNKKDEPRNGSLKLSKKVTGDGADQDKEFTFTVSLTAPAGSTLNPSYKISKNGGSDEDLALTLTDNDTKANISVTLKHNETWEIKNLPVGTSYTITEIDYTNVGYTASVTKGTAANGVAAGAITAGTKDDIEYTNTYSTVTITIEKVHKGDDSKKLNGAVFQLYRKSGGGSFEVFENDAFAVVGEGASAKKTGTFTISSGTITINNIPKGEYKLHEVSPPDGYVITGNSDTYFKVNDDKTITLTDENGTEVEKDASTGVQDTIMVKHLDGTFTVRNEPGASLPNAGGPGTNLIYILGILLTGIAGSRLIMRKKKKNPV